MQLFIKNMFFVYLTFLTSALSADDDKRFRLIIELAYHGSRAIQFERFDQGVQPWHKNQTNGEITNTGFR